jgi:hypothetical protein
MIAIKLPEQSNRYPFSFEARKNPSALRDSGQQYLGKHDSMRLCHGRFFWPNIDKGDPRQEFR